MKIGCSDRGKDCQTCVQKKKKNWIQREAKNFDVLLVLTKRYKKEKLGYK